MKDNSISFDTGTVTYTLFMHKKNVIRMTALVVLQFRINVNIKDYLCASVQPKTRYRP